MILRPAPKVSALNKEASPLCLDDRLQAEDDEAEEVDQEGDLHQGGIALESLGGGVGEEDQEGVGEEGREIFSPVVCLRTPTPGREGR